MLSFLNHHPFAVEAYFESSFVLTFAFPQAQLTSLVPEGLSLDLFEDEWAFLAVAMVQTKHLRPKGFPAWLGNDFFLIGYRLFVRFTNATGKRRRGLHILRSETDNPMMQLLGNLFTHYRYQKVAIEVSKQGTETTLSSPSSGFRVQVRQDEHAVDLPPESPFHDWKEARRFAGPLPFTFTSLPQTREMLIIEGVRQHWQPQPVTVLDYYIPFLDQPHLSTFRLASAFVVQEIPYHWKKGVREPW
ncbi:Uncharacterized conserved protein (COG2071) [Catalinimonas alkaloidigena]|uniref:Uncharacterized conserved protein (COG2071) n=1 Tax=Catalinimonas alkaloidigena TaxID=1075417 RepID=A0A1G8Y7P4_9BACT|nr:DUF2071 domain-containing protein [Catalinimonas alkaloidigena]SDJ98677.1 Uncharacterized conserved protein (COG2071) [Catalinimonas alkaloidigena]